MASLFPYLYVILVCRKWGSWVQERRDDELVAEIYNADHGQSDGCGIHAVRQISHKSEMPNQPR